MKKAKDIYENERWMFGNYQPMLEAFGNIAIQVDDKDYQGDSRVLYYKNGKIGYLQFGWGSCSGCDSLQACSNLNDVQELMDSLYESIKWFESKEEALKWFEDHDWEGDYSWHFAEQKEFVEKSKEYLQN